MEKTQVRKSRYATSVTDREVDFEGFVTHIADHGSPYSRGTIHGGTDGCSRPLAGVDSRRQSVRLSGLGLFSIGMSSKAEDTRDKVTAASVEGVHLIVRNTKTWSNSELRKKCKIEEYGAFTGTDNTGTSGGTSGGGSTQGGSGTTGGTGSDGQGSESSGGTTGKDDTGDGLE